MEKLLIIDDSKEIRKQLKWGLGKEYTVVFACNRKEAVSLCRKYNPKVVILDLKMPPNEDVTDEGFICLEEILKNKPLAKVIVITGNEERESALKAVKKGAYDYYQKPVDLNELKIVVNRAFHLYNIEEENRRFTLNKEDAVMYGILGQSPEMLNVFLTIRKVVSSDVSVLIQGESGTGKELVAKAIHLMSLRKDGSFVPIDCSAIPENLLESELFGYEKGAFTGAYAQVQGKFEYAHKGTLFLDEIGELPIHLQVKLLRFLQEKSVQRVGGREYIQVDARVIAASNTDIKKAIQEERFREDLYYRICVITINLPPLRDRGEDILLLSNLFLRRYSEEFNKKVRGFSASSIEFLESYKWPGNVRELENRIQRAVLMAGSALINPHDLGFTEDPARQKIVHKEGMTLKEVRDKVQRNMVISAIDKHDGNIARAAVELGVSRPTLYDLLKKHGLYNNK